ncbi:MAG: hypothetical protein AAFP19_05070 [Bacteroidota bacterium]
MKQLMSITLLIGLIAFGTSCNKSDDEVTPSPSSNYFIFGSYFGFCVGNCVNLYKLDGEELLEDDMDSMASLIDPVFGTSSLSQDKVDLARQLLDVLPTSLQKEGGIHGCPNCVDQGAFFIKLINEEGETVEWHLDTYRETLPEEVRDFVEEMTAVMGQL